MMSSAGIVIRGFILSTIASVAPLGISLKIEAAEMNLDFTANCNFICHAVDNPRNKFADPSSSPLENLYS